MEQQNEVVTTGQEAPVAAAEPVETPATTAPEGTAGASEAPTAPVSAEAEAKKALRGVQKRINELTRERYEAEERGKAEADRWRQQAIMQAQQLDQLRQQQTGPKLEQYPDLESYTAAMAQFQADRMIQTRMAQERQSNAEQQAAQRQQYEQAQAVQQFQSVVAQKIEAAEKKYPDFLDVVTSPELPGLQGTPAFNAILESESGAEVMYYLGKNPLKAHQLVGLSPIGQVREIGRIEAAIANGNLVSKAPPPPESIGSGKGNANKDPSRMSYDEFVAFRRKQIAQRR